MSLIISPPTSTMSTTSSRPSTITTPRARLSPLSSKRFSFDIICKFSFEIDTEQLRLRIQAITTSNVAVAAYIETEAITEHWFREEAEGNDRSGGQCGHEDVRAEEERDGNDGDES
ncbi:hypothetical protein AHAS_Ahas06G0148700 [Arachis hypogaea]